MSKVKLKPDFLKALKSTMGIVEPALKMVGISRDTYCKWKAKDGRFAAACERVTEEQIDFAESQLLKLIKAENPAAIIFYLKTKGKRRGYTERGEVERPKPSDEPKVMSETIQFQIETKKQEIITLLKNEGKYTPELLLQVETAAQLTVRRDILANEIFSDGYTPVNVEYSREGSVRRSVNPKEALYLDSCEKAQKALKALGMNTDSKERSTDGGDTSADFLSKHKMEGQ